MNEIWRPAVGWEGIYEISSLGAVRSLTRAVPGGRHEGPSIIKGRSLAGHIHQNGYREVTLRRPGVRKVERVHRLVAAAFIPNPEGKPHVNHIDNTPYHNSVDNLEWCTQAENLLHMTAQGRRKSGGKGKRSTNASLSEENVASIRARRERLGESYAILAEIFGTNKKTVQRIVQGKSYLPAAPSPDAADRRGEEIPVKSQENT